MGMALICAIVLGRQVVFGDGGLGERRGGTEAFEFVERSVEGALDAGFIAREAFDGAGTGGVVGESARTGVEGGGIFVAGELRHAEAEQAGFKGAHAAQAPGGHGHLLDEKGFRGSGGLVFGEEGVEQFLEFRGIFVGEDGGLGGEAVAEGVERDGGATFRSARAGGELGIATIGVKLALGRHRV